MINTIETVEAGQYARGAAINARITSDMNRARFTANERAKAATFADVLSIAYAGGIHINFRKTMITIKVMGGMIRDKLAAKQVMDICAQRGYKVRASAQGINFNITKIG
jgi:hypothetical protein